MRRTRLALFGALVSSALFVSACTNSPSNPTPPPTPTSTGSASPTTSATGSHPAPKVEHPLNPSGAYLADPCKLLTPAQLQKLNLADADGQLKRPYPGGLVCGLVSHRTGSRADVQAPTTFPNGLSSLYESHKKYPEGPQGYFVPASVAGFPAVLQDAVDDRDLGDCTVYVGINDRQVFSVHYDALLDHDEAKLKQACGLATRTAAQVIATLQR